MYAGEGILKEQNKNCQIRKGQISKQETSNSLIRLSAKYCHKGGEGERKPARQGRAKLKREELELVVCGVLETSSRRTCSTVGGEVMALVAQWGMVNLGYH